MNVERRRSSGGQHLSNKGSGKAGAKRPPFFFGFAPNVVVAGIASLFTDISSEIAYPLMPIFLSTVLGAPASAIGLIEGVAESTASILKLFSGWLSDRLRRRKSLVVVGYSLSNLIRPFLYFVTAWPQVLLVRFADRVGKGVRTAPRDAIIVDSTEEGNRGRAFGFHRAMDSVGAAIGPLIAAGILLAAKGSTSSALRTVFLVSAIPGAIAILILAFFLAERRPERETGPVKIRFAGLPRDFRAFSLVAALFALGNSSDVFLILRAKSVGIAVILIPLVYLVFNLVHVIFAIPAGSLSDRLGRRRVIAGGYVVFALVYLGFAFARSQYQIWVLFAFYGLYKAATDGVERAFVGDLVSKELRATAQGTFGALTGMALLPASVVGGVLWDRIGPQATFIYGVAFALLAAVGLAAFFSPGAPLSADEHRQ